MPVSHGMDVYYLYRIELKNCSAEAAQNELALLNLYGVCLPQSLIIKSDMYFSELGESFKLRVFLTKLENLANLSLAS